MIPVKLYSRKECKLCDETHAMLELLKSEYDMDIQVIDVDTSRELKKLYGLKIPVVVAGPYTAYAPHTLEDLRITIGAAIRGMEQDEEIERVSAPAAPPGGFMWTRSDSIFYWLSKHYLAIVNLVVLLYVGVPFLAPVLMKAGLDLPARGIYKVYGFFCHQFAFRSFFLFGEQVVYPREVAQVPGVLSYEEATGLHRDDIIVARSFTGTPEIGYKVALCERDVAIYGSILLFGLMYALVRRRIPPLPWYLWVAIALVPIGLDGVSQLVSQPPWNFLPYRESTPTLRVLTGFLFGWATAWFGIPMMEEAQSDTVRVMDARRKMIAGK